MIDGAATLQIRAQLLRGEALIWSGTPKQGIRFGARDGLIIPFSLLWCGFAIFWETMALRGGAPAFFPLFGVPFVLIGLFAVFGRFLLDSWLRRRTAYALTDRRILIARSGPWPGFTALSLDRLPEASLTELAGSCGTIRFGRSASLFDRAASGSMGFWVASLNATPQFLGIEDAQRVFAMIEERASRSQIA